MHVRRSLTLTHPWVFEAQHRLQMIKRRPNPHPEDIYEAEEAVEHARVSALADLLTGDLSQEQVRTLVSLLDTALLEFAQT